MPPGRCHRRVEPHLPSLVIRRQFTSPVPLAPNPCMTLKCGDGGGGERRTDRRQTICDFFIPAVVRPWHGSTCPPAHLVSRYRNHQCQSPASLPKKVASRRDVQYNRLFLAGVQCLPAVFPTSRSDKINSYRGGYGQFRFYVFPSRDRHSLQTIGELDIAAVSFPYVRLSARDEDWQSNLAF